MSPPANAAAIATVLFEIDGDPGNISTRSRQEAFLQQLTSKYKFRYYSSTYGHTRHDEKSLRSVLVAAMRHHGKAGEDIRPGKSPVDELFERGSEMLEDEYVKAVKRSAGEIAVEADGESGDGEEDSEIYQDLIDFVEAQSDSDEEYSPTATRRTRNAQKKRRPELPRCVANQRSESACIDDWIENCSVESSEGHPTSLDEPHYNTRHGTSCGQNASITVARGQKRKSPSSTTEAPADSGQKASSSPHLRRRTKHVGAKTSSERDTDPGRDHPRPRDSQLSASWQQRRAEGVVTNAATDNLFHVKLLAVATIAALL